MWHCVNARIFTAESEPCHFQESSAYYHGYVLAEMSVHQTRAHFKRTLGAIVDEPEVGKQLTEVGCDFLTSEILFSEILSVITSNVPLGAIVNEPEGGRQLTEVRLSETLLLKSLSCCQMSLLGRLLKTKDDFVSTSRWILFRIADVLSARLRRDSPAPGAESSFDQQSDWIFLNHRPTGSRATARRFWTWCRSSQVRWQSGAWHVHKVERGCTAIEDAQSEQVMFEGANRGKARFCAHARR